MADDTYGRVVELVAHTMDDHRWIGDACRCGWYETPMSVKSHQAHVAMHVATAVLLEVSQIRGEVLASEREDGREWLAIREAARRLGVHENTVRNYIESGALSVRMVPGKSGYRRVSAADVELLQAQKSVKRPTQNVVESL